MTRTIRVASDVYEIPSKERIEGESFSDVIRRISRRKPSLLEFAGAWKDIPEEEFQRSLDCHSAWNPK